MTYRRNELRDLTSEIYKRELAVDVYDAAMHALVWKGVSGKTLGMTIRDMQRSIEVSGSGYVDVENFDPTVMAVDVDAGRYELIAGVAKAAGHLINEFAGTPGEDPLHEAQRSQR